MKILQAVFFALFVTSPLQSLLAAVMKTPVDLTGTWSLVSFDILDKDGRKTSWCDGMHGFLTYTKDGYMSASINCDKPSDKSSAHAYGDRLLYAGTFNVVEGPSVVHHVKNANVDTIIGTDLKRKIEHLDKNGLTLSGEFGGNFSIVWKRASQ